MKNFIMVFLIFELIGIVIRLIFLGFADFPLRIRREDTMFRILVGIIWLIIGMAVYYGTK